MKRYLKIGTLLLTFLLFLTPVSADEYFFNGGNAAPGSNPNQTDCTKTKGFCLYNASHGSKGIRVSLAYCDSNGCTQVKTLNNKSVTVHDYFNNATYFSSYYVGKTKVDPQILTLSQINKNTKEFYHSKVNPSSGNDSNISIASISLFLSGGSSYFNNLDVLAATDEGKDRVIAELLPGLGVTKDDINVEMSKKNVACSQRDTTCEGYRILIEPIFWWKYDYANQDWLLTPTEVAYLSKNYTQMAFGVDYRLYTSAVSLHISKNDVYFQPWARGQYSLSAGSFAQADFTFRDEFQVSNSGLALNIINPIYDYTNFDCKAIKNAILWDLDGTIANAYNSANGLARFYAAYPNGISFDKGNNQIGHVDAKWYVNECTCYGMYEYFDTYYTQSWKSQWQAEIQALGASSILGPNWFDRLNNVQMKDLTQSRVNSVLTGSIFSTYNNAQQTYIDALNKKSTDVIYAWTTANIDKYNELGCGTTTYKNQCEQLENWYNMNRPSNYARLTEMTASQLKNQYFGQASNMFKAYNTIYANATGVYWDHDMYISQCLEDNPKPDPEPTIYNCTPKYNLGECITGDISYYTDSDGRENDEQYWQNCIFNNKGTYDANVAHKQSYKEEKLGSANYCQVYCIEEMTAVFDNGNFTVKAGSNFVWGAASVRGSRTCRTKSINWNTFDRNLKDDNQAIRKAYFDWQFAQAKQNAVINHSVKYNSPSCGCRYNTDHNDCCTSERTVEHKEKRKECDEEDENGKCKHWHHWIETYYTYPCTSRNNQKFDLYTARASFTLSSSGSYSRISDSWTESWCEDDTAPRIDVTTPQRRYNSIKNSAVTDYNNMVSCSNWDKTPDTIYKVSNDLTLKYSDNTLYAGYEKKMTLVKDQINYDLDNVNDCEEVEVSVVDPSNCRGTQCPVEIRKINKCTTVKMTRSIKDETDNAKYQIDQSSYRYVLKTTSNLNNYHLSIHLGDLSKYESDDFTTNYIDIGYGNLPVSYSAKDGAYGFGTNRGELSISYYNLGHDNGTGSTAVDQIFGIGSGNKAKWECQYNVKSELIPEKPTNPTNSKNPKGINVIYRPIDLFDPFPDIDATGRKTGSNWCFKTDSCDSRNKTVEQYILNNRGVANDDVYKQEPMYTFIITPAVVNEIRKYNKENGYDEYTGSLNNNSYDYVCKEGTGGTCISEYLTHIIDITNARNEPGSCVQDRTRNVNDSTSFENCRY